MTLLGRISESDKAELLSSVDLYVAPHTGGESFGIVLLEAMSAGSAGTGQRPAGIPRCAGRRSLRGAVPHR